MNQLTKNSNQLNQTNLTLIAHSESTAAAFAGLAAPKLNLASKINLFIALAPLSRIDNTKV